MTSGANNVSLRSKLPWLVLAGMLLMAPADRAAANEPGATEQTAPSAGWNVEQLIESLARSRPPEVRFVERAFSNFLTEPLKSTGTLRFTPPATLEKHILTPNDERYLIEGDKVLFHSKTRRIRRTFSLGDSPVLRAFVEAFRATLASDVTTLKRYYEVTLEGTPHRWKLILRPLDKAVMDMVETIRFFGEDDQVKGIDVMAPDGDRSIMIITTSAP